jgi:hypothetical protein
MNRKNKASGGSSASLVSLVGVGGTANTTMTCPCSSLVDTIDIYIQEFDILLTRTTLSSLLIKLYHVVAL